KLFWRSDTRDLYENAIEVCYLQGNMADAFYFFERSRAVLLNEQVKEQYGLSEKDILELMQVKKMIQRLEGEIDSTKQGSTRYDELRSAIFSQQQELNRLQQQIKSSNPIYYQNNVDTSFSSLAEIRGVLLKDHEALLELFTGDQNVYTLLVLPGNTFLEKIEKKKYDSATNIYMNLLSSAGSLNSHFREFVKVSHYLYQLIFKDHSLPGGRIIISPSGRENFPFESLIKNEDVAYPNYFLYDHAISYAYSARYLMNDFLHEKSGPEGNFLGVAPVRYPEGLSLSDLHGSDLSLQNISSYFPHTNNLLINNATRNNFLRQFSKYTIIQLYTHAIDSGKNGEPVIYFSDSSLYLSELIAESKPVTRLMVLSACQTGNGKLYEGEGVFSFNRGFAAMGIPSSIINLWSVDNRATYQVTEIFYKYLSQGLPVDIALQKAKIEFMQQGTRENRLPYYWAAAVVVGKTEAISSNTNSSWKNLFWLLILVPVTLAFF
ncbi:MAG TPA: CHAT domain-containing protein, partial [Puia sp.]|nr:CHAT domain-containing protein [Puia sp.]